MIYALIVIIAVLSTVIFWQGARFGRSRIAHEKKVGELQYVIVQLTANNEDKLAQLKLSDELREKLQSAREKIDRELMAVQRDLVEKLSKNGLAD